MIHLTKQEQQVIWLLTVLLLAGCTVKVYRTAHPPITAVEQAKK